MELETAASAYEQARKRGRRAYNLKVSLGRSGNLPYLDELLSNVEALSKETKLSRDWWDTFIPVLPAIKVRNVHFSSGTEF
jgi:hypothetical protein